MRLSTSLKAPWVAAIDLSSASASALLSLASLLGRFSDVRSGSRIYHFVCRHLRRHPQETKLWIRKPRACSMSRSSHQPQQSLISSPGGHRIISRAVDLFSSLAALSRSPGGGFTLHLGTRTIVTSGLVVSVYLWQNPSRFAPRTSMLARIYGFVASHRAYLNLPRTAISELGIIPRPSSLSWTCPSCYSTDRERSLLAAQRNRDAIYDLNAHEEIKVRRRAINNPRTGEAAEYTEHEARRWSRMTDEGRKRVRAYGLAGFNR